jgi:hypothetical protein
VRTRQYRQVETEFATEPVDLVVPLLQERGIYKRDYEEGTLREKLFGSGRARLVKSHPGASFRTIGSSAPFSQTIAPAAE